MDVIHLSAYADGGGAARAVRTLVHELNMREPGNSLWSWQDEPGVDFLHKVPVRSGLSPRLFRGIDRLSSRILAPSVERPKSLSVVNSVDFRELKLEPTTVVNLHWIAQNFLSISTVKKLNNSLVWSLYDLWAINGSSFYPEDAGSKHLMVRRSIRQKKEFLELPRVQIVCPSSWIAERILAKNPGVIDRLHVIPHAVDPNQIPILDSSVCRELLGIEQEQRLILFAGHSNDAWRKGADRLLSFIGSRPRGLNDVGLVIMGSSGHLFRNIGSRVYEMGSLHDQVTMNLVFAAADVVCVPSRQDALPLVALEALVSGTPVVVTEDNGARDLANTLDGAFSAGLGDAESMSSAFHAAFDAAPDRFKIRDTAVKAFGSTTVSDKYLDLYSSLPFGEM